MVYGTRAFQLAMLVVYESPLQVLCDTPYAYRQSPEGLDLLKLVPTTWDETRVLNGEVGNFITETIESVRGLVGPRDRVICGLSGGVEIPNDHLPAASRKWLHFAFAAINPDTGLPAEYPELLRSSAGQIWQDAAPGRDNLLVQSSRNVTSQDTLQVNLASGGGTIIRLTPNPVR